MNPRGQGVDDDLVNLGLILIAALGLIAAVLRPAGSVAAWLTTAEQPQGGLEAGFRVLRHPADPASALRADGLSVWVYWLVEAAGAGEAQCLSAEETGAWQAVSALLLPRLWEYLRTP